MLLGELVLILLPQLDGGMDAAVNLDDQFHFVECLDRIVHGLDVSQQFASVLYENGRDTKYGQLLVTVSL